MLIYTRNQHSHKYTNTPLILVFRFLLWGRSTWLQHLFQKVELDPSLALILPNSQVVGQVIVSHQAGIGVPVLISCPFKLGGIRMSSAHILGLQMLHLGQNVIPVSHLDGFLSETLVEVNQAILAW